jgi:hypothetical protein
MNALQLPSALKDGPEDLTEEDLHLPAEHLPDEDGAGSTATWLMVVTGCLSAAIVASLICRLPKSHALSWITIFLRSVLYIALTAGGGTIGIGVGWFFLKAKPSSTLPSFSRSIVVGWMFFPCIALLYRQQSFGMFLVLALATAAVAFSLRQIFPLNVETDQRELPDSLPSLYGLPITTFRPLRAFFIALCAQAALIFAITGYLFLAGAMLSTGLFLLVRRWSASNSNAVRKFTRDKQLILLCALAIVLTTLALAPWVGGRQYGSVGAKEVPRRPPLVDHQPPEPEKFGSEYVGIILLPPPKKKTEIIQPIPQVRSVAIGRTSKPVVILFNGQYWYFKAPSKRPGLHAHLAHGEPTDVNIHSTDRLPLLMEAHQDLGSSIDLGCCSEIDIAITNADNRLGKIAVAVRLTDSSSIGKPSQELVKRAIVSSEAVQIPLNRPPVKEVLRFQISRSTTMHRFDEISVVFLPARERALGGAKVSVQSFTLIPR